MTATLTRDQRSSELARLPKDLLVQNYRVLGGYVMPRKTLRTWRKDELVTAILDREYPPTPATSGAPASSPEAAVPLAAPGEARQCERCGKPADHRTEFCCSSHGKRLCHACYRTTHFVEVCSPCSICDPSAAPGESRGAA